MDTVIVKVLENMPVAGAMILVFWLGLKYLSKRDDQMSAALDKRDAVLDTCVQRFERTVVELQHDSKEMLKETISTNKEASKALVGVREYCSTAGETMSDVRAFLRSRSDR